jgi:hypothetical protein
MTFTIKQNDTAPALEAQLLDSEGNPINLDMCGVRFHMQSRYVKKTIIKPATIVDAENGLVRVDWQEGDTDTVSTYKCEFQVTFTDNTILTIPNDGYFQINIIRELA